MSFEIELPAFYVDDVELDDLGIASGDAFMIRGNRIPEPGETQVHIHKLVSFDILMDTNTSETIDQNAVNIYVTYDDGDEFQIVEDSTIIDPDWTGDSAAFPIGFGDYTLSVRLDKITPFEPLQEVTMRVTATSTSGTRTLDDSWTFTTQDLISPKLTNAFGRDKKTLRVQFDEDVVVTSASNSNSALNPNNWSVQRNTDVSVILDVDEVILIDAQTVDLVFDIEMTPEASYTLAASNIEDEFGNVIESPNDEIEFTGFVPQIPEARNFDLWNLVIPKINRDLDTSGDLRKFISIIQEVVDLMLCEIDSWSDILDPDVAAEEYLDAMLEDLGNPFQFDLTVNEKRRLIRVLVSAYKQKGTEVGIINLIRFFTGIEVTIDSYYSDNWELGIDELGVDTQLGPSSTFSIYAFDVVSPEALDDDTKSKIEDVVDFMKPGHTHLVQIREP